MYMYYSFTFEVGHFRVDTYISMIFFIPIMNEFTVI